MTDYAAKPWVSLYDTGVRQDFCPSARDALALFKRGVRTAPDRASIHYFTHTFTTSEVDRCSDALAVALQRFGLRHGERIAVYCQNVPQFVFAVLAAWKSAAVVVPINPMLRQRELAYVLNDCGARILVTLESLYRDVVVKVLSDTPIEHVITTSELDCLGDESPSLLAGSSRARFEHTHDLMSLIEQVGDQRPPEVDIAPEDIAFLPYTSGTTGPPKGAMNTHANVVFNSEALVEWVGMRDDDVIVALAPLFHITGLIVQMTFAFAGPFPLILSYRFDPITTARLIEFHKATFSVAAITAYIALMNSEGVSPGQLASLRCVYSGGAPIAPASVGRFKDRFGLTIISAYGLTESTAPAHLTPVSRTSPVDPHSGALTIGVPFCGVSMDVVGDDGRSLAPGEVGELLIGGPMVVPGYWNKPEETAHAFVNGRLHTGDVGFMDEQGWCYIVDRKKDLIVASGYKVWPREVEDVLYTHQAVREAAVVGVPDEYRGETVKAFVSLEPGAKVTPKAIIDHCREALAAYKRPTEVEILEELPKTASGKILRRELRPKKATGATGKGG